MIRGLEQLCCDDRLGELGAVQPGEEKAPGRPYNGLPVPQGAYRKAGDKLYSKACCNRARGSGFKLKEGRFRLDIRKAFSTMRVVRHWHRLPRKVVAAPSREVPNASLDRALSNLVWWEVSLPMAGSWNYVIFKVHSNPNHSITINRLLLPKPSSTLPSKLQTYFSMTTYTN